MNSTVISKIDNSIQFISTFVMALTISGYPDCRDKVRSEYSKDYPEIRLGRKFNANPTAFNYTQKEFDLLFNNMTNPTFVLAAYRNPFSDAIVSVQDAIVKAGAHDYNNPTLEFLRHIRNAISHGNRMNFDKNKRPFNPANFDGIHIFESMHGTENVLFDFIMPGDIIVLFKAIKEIP